ncbi:MAG: Rab family GTPase [Candidatus Hodarchaeota archaeon]
MNHYASDDDKRQDHSYTHRAKIIVVGDAAVGKTSLIVRYVKGVFNPGYIITLGVNFFSQDVTILDKTLRYIIWDTAGQERFGPVRKKYYLGARGALLVFDLTNLQSFEHLDFWVKEIEGICGEIPVLLVGNKADLTPVVKQSAIQEYATLHNMTYVETSAKTGMNSIRPFFLLAPLILGELNRAGRTHQF